METGHFAGCTLYDDAGFTIRKDAHDTLLRAVLAALSFCHARTERSAASNKVDARMIG
jgi:hypothetical protein